ARDRPDRADPGGGASRRRGRGGPGRLGGPGHALDVRHEQVRIDSVRFACSVFRPEDAPESSDRDVIFVGRSNVGKSSLINRLVGKSGIARVSSTPGRTQSVNFVRVNEAFHLVDFPGYGYARVPEEIRRSWKHLVDGVLEARRRRIVLAVMVMDARHPPSDLDHAMR